MPPVSSEDVPFTRSLGIRRLELTGTQKVWLLTAAVAAAAAMVAVTVADTPALDAPLRIPLPLLIALFYAAELAVVHLEFGRQAHSFSMSEFPLVIGLFFAAPLEVILANLVANALVLTIHRRQPLLKFCFNLAQFALQVGIAVGVFHMYAHLGDPLGPAGWAGAVIATLGALLAADVLINAAIVSTGGRLTLDEMLEVFGLSALAAVLNAGFALGAVVILWHQPGASWLAALPPLALFVAYWAYVSQRVERTRLKALYDATRDLHAAPQIERALARAAQSARSMLNAESAEVYLLPDGMTPEALLTSSGPGDASTRMAPVSIVGPVPDWHEVVETGRTAVLNAADGGRGDSARCAVAAPLIGSDGDLLGVVVVRNRLGNVTGFTDSDVETLETFAAQIGVSVSNDRLVDSLTQANLLNRQQEGLIKARDEFIASVSHELRTPLTTVVGLSQLLQSEEGETLNPEEREELTSLIVDQSIELSDLVEDLLVSARADVGNLHVTPRAVSLRGEVEAVLRAMRCEEFVGLLGESSTVWADALRLRQVVRNLVTNARRYGGERIWVELARRPDGAILSVVDNGAGVAAGRERKIFEAYGRAHEPGSQPASIGLGLHVARQLARQMGGDLVYRRHDGLTRFELTLPAAA